jgi:NodT family efflux transporter outer membrane factor (OMF) lipoprotein
MPGRYLLSAFLASLTLTTTACSVGPPYQRPEVQIPAGYKELNGWKVAQPRDDVSRGQWWEIFQDPQLNALAEQVNVANQNIAAAEARLRGARASVRVARAALFPTVTDGVEISGMRQSANRAAGGSNATGARANYALPIDVSYEPDIWGRLRRNVDLNIANAQASAADLETIRLNMHAELAVNYFALQGIEAQKQLLELTIAAFERALELTLNRYNQGVASRAEVEQARTQLEGVRAQVIDLGVQRAQVEHAIAILIGKPPAELTIPPVSITVQPPAIPVGLPSELLERRPDIAAAERRMVAANAQLGIAQAAFFPTVILSAAVGLESSNIANLFSWPSAFWAIGSALAHAAFDGGRRQAVSEEVQAAYDATVATYRQIVLTAFQSVEDNLAALRILEEEAAQQEKVVQAAETALLLAINRYKGGVTNYLEVIIVQSAALTARRNAVDLTTRRMAAAVLLIKALGGSWKTPPAETKLIPSGRHAAFSG